VIDRHGHALIVGCQAHEILWLRAAMELPFRKRGAAYRQVADMTTRSLDGVRRKAQLLGRIAREEARLARQAATDKDMPLDILPPFIINDSARVQTMRAGRRAW